MTRTLPYSAYVDDQVLDRERATVFANSWQYVGNTADLAENTVVPIDVLGLPVVLTRAEDVIHALVNVCAHRGSIVSKEPTEAGFLTCPYHAWRYSLDGSLIRAPRSERETDFEEAAHSLELLQTRTWGPFIFVAMSAATPSFEEFLGDLPDLVKRAGIDVDDLVFHHRATSHLEANWKICVENFLECYHCRVAHPSFSKTIDTSPDEYELEPSATFSTQYGPVRDNWVGSFDPTGPVPRGQFHLLYPNTAINILPGEPNLSIGPMMPASAGATDRFLDYFFATGLSEEWIGNLIAFDDQVGREDVVLVEDMQRGMTARPARSGTLFMDSENLIAHFEDHIRRAMGT